MSKFPENDAKFDELRALELPLGHYAVTSSGPLGVRGVRPIGDIDLVVDDDLWAKLSATHAPTERDGVLVIELSDTVEVLGKGSFFVPPAGQHPGVADQIAEAEMIEGLPFVNLRHILHFKRLMNRPKDAADIAAIEELLG